MTAREDEVTTYLLRAAHAVTRTEAIRHLMDAVSHGLPAVDAMKALGEWDKANPVQRLGGAA